KMSGRHTRHSKQSLPNGFVTSWDFLQPLRLRITKNRSGKDTRREQFADIIVNNDGNRLICFWTVHRFGSPDILAWGQERSFDAAQHEAVQELDCRCRQSKAS